MKLRYTTRTKTRTASKPLSKPPWQACRFRATATAVLKLTEEGVDSAHTPGNFLVAFIHSKRFNPFIINNKEPEKFKPITCYKANQKINGYEATVLVDICDGILEARKQGVKFSVKQKLIADQCEILVRSFAKVGIIALVDEATGYQYEREKYELQTILKAFISDEILEWQRIFQLSFYKEIFRLWRIPFTPENIRRKPLFIGKLTNELVYKNLPKGTFVLEKLKEKTPRNSKGKFKYRLHQSLTPDQGREALKKVLYSLETLANISETKEKFKRLVKSRYGQKEIPFDEIEEEAKPTISAPLTKFDKLLKGLLSIPPPKDK